MIEIIKFTPEHWDGIQEQEATAHLRPLVPEESVVSLAESEFSYTVISGERIVAIAGVLEYWPGRAEAWAELAAVSRREFLAIHNAVSRFLDICPYDRVEAVVDVNFEAGHRWARLLGFKGEANIMRKYGIDGRDYALYARVR